MTTKLVHYLTLEEVTKILKAVPNYIKPKSQKKVKMAIILGFGSGLRISEIVGLHKEISGCCNANLRYEITKIGKKSIKRRICSKCGSIIAPHKVKRHPTELKIPPLAKENIDLKSHQIKILSGKGEKDRITVTSPWLNESNIEILPVKMNIRTLQYNFSLLCNKVLNKRCNFHQLRHGFGNYMVNVKKIPITMVQALMGHSRIDTTSVYAKANPVDAVNSAWEAFA